MVRRGSTASECACDREAANNPAYSVRKELRAVRLSPTQIDEAQAAWEAYKAATRARSLRRSQIDASTARAIVERFGLRKDFDLRARLNVATADYFAHAHMDEKGTLARLERREDKILRTLARRVIARRRPDRIEASLRSLGIRGNVRLMLSGWNGNSEHPSLQTAVKKALARVRGRYPSAHVLWAQALACIYAHGSPQPPVVRRAKDGSASGPLVEFIAACSAETSINARAVSLSTLRRIAKSGYVAYFLAKRAAPF